MHESEEDSPRCPGSAAAHRSRRDAPKGTQVRFRARVQRRDWMMGEMSSNATRARPVLSGPASPRRARTDGSTVRSSVSAEGGRQDSAAAAKVSSSAERTARLQTRAGRCGRIDVWRRP